MSARFDQTTRRHIAGDGIPHNHHREKLKRKVSEVQIYLEARRLGGFERTTGSSNAVFTMNFANLRSPKQSYEYINFDF
jgi:hypothetical protein